MPVPIGNIGSGSYGTSSKSDGSKIDAEQIETLFEEMDKKNNKSQENIAGPAAAPTRPGWFTRTFSKEKINKDKMRRDSKSPEQH